MRTAGVVATAVGGAGLVFGFIAGAVTLSKKSTADDSCPAAGCNPTGVTAESSGKTWSAVSTVGVIAGAAVLATGITLIVLAPAHPADAPVASGLRLTRVGLVPSFAGAGASVGLAGSF